MSPSSLHLVSGMATLAICAVHAPRTSRLVSSACVLGETYGVVHAKTDLDARLVSEASFQLHQRAADFVAQARLAAVVRRSPGSRRPMRASPGVVAVATGCHGTSTTMSVMADPMRVRLCFLRHGMCPGDGIRGFGLCDFGVVAMSKPRQKARFGCASCSLCYRTGHDGDLSDMI